MNQQAQSHQLQNRHALLRSISLRTWAITWLAGLLVTSVSLLKPLPAMAWINYHAQVPSEVATMSTVAAMPNKTKAVVKDAEGKLESAYGGLTGDTGRQIKGNLKQKQSSAMKAGEDLKESAKSAANSVAKKVGDATR